MADSSKSTGLAKSLVDAKNEATKESKKKRKRGKKFRAKFNENTEEESQECSTLVRDEQNVEGNHEDAKTDIGEDSQMGATSEKTESAAKIGEENSTQQSDRMATDGAVQGSKNSEKIINKNDQQEHKTIQESSGEQKVAVLEQIKQEEVDGRKLKSKRASFSLLRSKKNSKSKLSYGEDKRTEDMSDEYGIWKESEKAAGKDGETSEQHEKDEAKIKLEASSVDKKSNDAEKSPEGTQEKFLRKGKGKKLKHLSSFGRSKKKVDITTKKAEFEIPDNEIQELIEERPVRLEKFGSTRDEVSQSSENASNEPVLVHTSDSNAAVEAETESDKKDGRVPKSKKSFLGLKRNKKLAKMGKSSTNEDEQKTKIDESENISESKENDDVSITAGARVESEAVEIEEKNPVSKEEKVKPNAAKTANLQAEETSEAAESNDGSINKETSSPEGKEHGARAAEETGHVSSKKERKSGLLRSFKKLKSPNKSQQGKKKSQENANSMKENEDAAKKEKVEQTNKGQSSKPEQTTEVKESAEEINEECASNREETSKAVKRKTSDLKNIEVTQVMKRKKEDDENVSESQTDIQNSQDNDEGIEGETVEQQQDQSASEEISALQTEKNVKEECVDEFTSEANKELSQQKNNEQEQTENKESEVKDENPRELLARDDTQEQPENKESEVEDENPRESLARDDTQDEEVWNEAHELCRTLMKTVKEFKDKKETQQAEERPEGKDTAIANQTQMGEVDEDAECPAEKQDMEQESENESIDSAITIVSVEQLSCHEPKIGAEHTQLKHKGVSSETERTGVATSQADDRTEPKAEETSPVTEAPIGEAENKKDNTEESSETDISRESQAEQETEPKTDDAEKMRTIQEEVSSESEMVESKAEDKTEPKAEDAEEIRVGNEGVSSETEILQVDSKAEDNTENPEDSSETETSRYTKPREEHETETKIEDTKESPETEASEANESTVEQEAEHRTEDPEESSGANTSQVLASQVEQTTEPKTEDAEVVESKAEDKTKPTTKDAEEIRAIHEEVCLESEVVESKPEDTEPTNEIAEEARDFHDGVSSEHELVESNTEEKTEPNNEDSEEIQVSNEEPSSENVTSETTNDVEITRKKTRRDKRKDTWIMVQHLEMNEEVNRQLGHMLTALNTFKRTTACCAIM